MYHTLSAESRDLSLKDEASNVLIYPSMVKTMAINYQKQVTNELASWSIGESSPRLELA